MQRVTIVLVGVAVLVVTSMGGLWVVDLLTQPTRQPVAVVGDSITAIGTRQLESNLGSAYKAEVRATFGARIDEQLAAASELAATKPEQVVINLGTNDVLQGVDPDQSLAALEQMAAMFTSARCVHFVTVSTTLEQDGRRPRREAEALNARILSLSEKIGTGDVVRWDRLSKAAVSDDRPLGLTDDGVHPSPAGQRAISNAVADALQRCGRPWHIW